MSDIRKTAKGKEKKTKTEFLIRWSRNSGQGMPAVLLADKHHCLLKEMIRSHLFHLPPYCLVLALSSSWGGGEGQGSFFYTAAAASLLKAVFVLQGL